MFCCFPGTEGEQLNDKQQEKTLALNYTIVQKSTIKVTPSEQKRSNLWLDICCDSLVLMYFHRRLLL